MIKEKFHQEVITLKDFFECYCKGKHKNQKTHNKILIYKEEDFSKNLFLCENCLKDINYCFQRLQECPHEEKPKCRKCSTPCYEKEQWKITAKIMGYSGIKLGISRKIRKLFKKQPS